MKFTFAIFIVRFLSIAPAFAGNGSIAVGNAKFQVTDTIVAREAKENDFMSNSAGDRILDGATGEPLFSLDHVNKETVSASAGGELVRSRMGAITGFEFIQSSGNASPNQKSADTASSHFWLICEKGTECLRLTPLSRSNPKVDSLMGALKAK